MLPKTKQAIPSWIRREKKKRNKALLDPNWVPVQIRESQEEGRIRRNRNFLGTKPKNCDDGKNKKLSF